MCRECFWSFLRWLGGGGGGDGVNITRGRGKPGCRGPIFMDKQLSLKIIIIIHVCITGTFMHIHENLENWPSAKIRKFYNFNILSLSLSHLGGEGLSMTTIIVIAVCVGVILLFILVLVVSIVIIRVCTKSDSKSSLEDIVENPPADLKSSTLTKELTDGKQSPH